VQSDVSKANDRESNTTAGTGGTTSQFEGPSICVQNTGHGVL